MQVLVKNKNAEEVVLKDVIESFWDANCFYPNDDFSVTSLFELSGSLRFSPFYFLDARLAFMISQLEKESSIYVQGLGPLGTVAALGFSGSGFHQEDPVKVRTYVKEYLPSDPIKMNDKYDLIINFGETSINTEQWKKLKVGGFYLGGSIGGPINLTRYNFEAFGKIWPFGEATEFGWHFNVAELGLENFYFVKIKKLA